MKNKTDLASILDKLTLGSSNGINFTGNECVELLKFIKAREYIIRTLRETIIKDRLSK